MSEWITDRKPSADCNMVWNSRGVPTFPELVKDGEPWKPIPTCEPYVKPKRYTVKWLSDCQQWAVMDGHYVATRLPKLHIECDEHREAAERIAAIYEEAMP